MFSPANQAHFVLEIDGAEHDFKVLEYSSSLPMKRSTSPMRCC